MKFRYEKETEELVVSSATRIEYHQINIWLTRHVKGLCRMITKLNPPIKF